MDPLTVTCGALEILWEKLDPGEFAKLRNHLPESLRSSLRPLTGQRRSSKIQTLTIIS
jgi:uncharacterized protein (DUF2267 family)